MSFGYGANPAEYVSDPLKVIKLDALSAINIIDLSVKNKKIIFTSTSEVYGKSSKMPFKEKMIELLDLLHK